MVTFRKKTIIQDLMPEALEYLREQGIRPNIIKPEEAEAASKVNSKSMVLVSFIKNENGFYQIQVKDKELYKYTQKLLKDMFKMRITDVDKTSRIVTAEVDRLGIALDIIEVLAIKYNLSLVEN